MAFSNLAEGEVSFHLPGKRREIYVPQLSQFCTPKRNGVRIWSTEDPVTRVKALRIRFIILFILKNLNEKMANPLHQCQDQKTIFYQDKKLFGFGSVEALVNGKDDSYNKFFVPALDEVCMLLETTRLSFGITVEARGWIIGPVILSIGEKVHIDCTSKYEIITDNAILVDGIRKTGEIRFVLVVEKANVFNILKGIDFHTKQKCVVITGKGYPTVAVRATVRKLYDSIKVPVYALVDLDRDGLQIMCTYKYGSKNCAFDNLNLSVEDLIWLGMHPTHFLNDEDEPPTPSLSDSDYEII